MEAEWLIESNDPDPIQGSGFRETIYKKKINRVQNGRRQKSKDRAVKKEVRS